MPGKDPGLCASCDRCRARKTKCDGKRPCQACKNKYMKQNKLTSVVGIDPALFECVYSPAKRRGPVPGHKGSVSVMPKPKSTRKNKNNASRRNAASNTPNSSSNGYSSTSTSGADVAPTSTNNNNKKKPATTKPNSSMPLKKRRASRRDSSETIDGAMSVDQLKNPQPPNNNSKTSPKRKASCDINSLRASNISNFRGSINTTDSLGLGSLLNSNRRASTSIDNPFLIPTRTMDGPGSSALNTNTNNNNEGGGYSRRASVTSTGSFGGLTCMSGFTSDMLVESLSQLDNNNNNRNHWQQNDLSSSVNAGNMMQPPTVNINSSVGFNNNGSLTGSATQALNFNNVTNPASSLLPPLDPSAAAMQQHVLSTLGSIGLNMFANVASSVADNSDAKGGIKGEEDKKKAASSRNNNEQSSIKTSESTDTNKLDVHQNAAQQQLAYIQQLQVQQQMEAQKQRRTMNDIALTSAAQQGGDEGSIANTIMEIMNRPSGYNSSKTTKASSSNKRRRSRDRGDADSYTGSTGSMNDGMFGLSGNKSVASGTQTLLDAAELMNDEADISPVLGDGKPILKSSSNHHHHHQQQQIGCAHLSVLKFITLTSPSDTSGSHIRANYTLSFGGLFELPSIPTDEEYCSRFDKSLEPYQLPKFDVAALQAARFAELALGALVDSSSSSNNSTLVVELTNASVLCLRDCIEERVHPSLMFDMARSFFFHAILRLYLDKDMIYYFKFRRVCLRHLCQLDGYPGVTKLIAAISFQDSLVYMICNGADEDDLPNIDRDIPRALPPHPHSGMAKSTAEKKFGVSISPSRVASIDINQMWIQGTPPVFINDDASVKSRVIDGLACAIRTSLDEAKALQTKEEPQQSSRGRIISRKKKYAEDSKDKSATQWAVEHYPNELSNSNIVHETTSLLQADKEATFSLFRGHDLVTIALESIVNSDRDVKYVPGQSILNILEGIIDRPILLYQGGPTYHIISNCAILLAHKINKLHSTVIKDHNECLKEQYDTALDIYKMARLVLEKHRSKLPLRLQCHEVPSVSSTTTANESGLLIDLNKMKMCTSYNCLDCVTMGGISVKKEEDKGLSDSVSSSGRKRKAPELFVARPSKSGLGVQDGDEMFLAGKSLSSPDRDKKQEGTNERVSLGESRGQITEPERELDINDQALMAALSRTISQKERR